MLHLSKSLSPEAAAQIRCLSADPKDLLFAVLTSLSKIRGSQSYLFCTLLHDSQSILRLDAVPTAMELALPCRLDCEKFDDPIAVPSNSHPSLDAPTNAEAAEEWSQVEVARILGNSPL